MEIAQRSAAYFREHGRPFPWRQERDPFRLAVAEILLQKTRAANVVDVYRDLTSAYPTAGALSRATHATLESLLTPLGLSRKRAAQLIGMALTVEAGGSDALRDWRAVSSGVPGLGAYGARAIACFGYGEAVGLVDANIARILRRVFRTPTRDPRAIMFQRYADAIAETSESTRATFFGLLDLGAKVCTTSPLCDLCPLADFCSYRRQRARHRRAAFHASPFISRSNARRRSITCGGSSKNN